VESPYAADIATNTDFVKNVCKYVLTNGKALASAEASPFAMHLLFPQFLDEDKLDERTLGIECGLAWVEKADEVWFCLAPRHTEMSGGMTAALTRLANMPQPPELRFLRFSEEGVFDAEYTSSTFDSKKERRI
jgi:hypothetical protein